MAFTTSVLVTPLVPLYRRRIQPGVRGARKISRSEDGDLVLAMDEGEMRRHKPVADQENGGVRQPGRQR